MISKEEFVLDKIKAYTSYHLTVYENINPTILNDLIEQWSFDYEMEKEYRPEILHK